MMGETSPLNKDNGLTVFPVEFVPFAAFKVEDDDRAITPVGQLRGIYSTPIDNALKKEHGQGFTQVAYMSKGHPFVDRLFIGRYKLVGIEEIPCDRSARARSNWKRKHGWRTQG